VFADLLRNVSNGVHVCDILLSLSKHVCNLLNDNVTNNKLIKTITLSSDYKSDSYFVCVFMNNLKNLGVTINTGDKIEFIVVEDTDKNIKQSIGDKCRSYDLWSHDPNREEIDYSFYLNGTFKSNYDRLFKEYVNVEIEDLGYEPYYVRNKPVNFNEPLKMILLIIKDLSSCSDSEIGEILSMYDISYDKSKSHIANIAIYIDLVIRHICEKIYTDSSEIL